MIIHGNTVGTTMPRADYAETDENKSTFIRNKPDAAIRKAQTTADEARATAEAALPKEGGTLTGGLDMGGNAITNIPDPAYETDPATKGYVDHLVKEKHLVLTLNLPASGWSVAAPYAQQLSAASIASSDTPHFGVLYTENWEAEKESFALVDQLETSDGSVTFTCFGEKPLEDLTIQMEVNR